jgi:hypothetical protein
MGICPELNNLTNNDFIILVKIGRFNRAKPQPDVLEEEKLYAYPSSITSETGFR